ncbi:MAG: hypothetical protein ACRD3S_08455 [Terracidiphilus sp.]
MTNASSILLEPEPALEPALNSVEVQLTDDPFLLNRFEDFYREVVRLKSSLDAARAEVAPEPGDVQQQLTDFLAIQSSEVERTGTLLGTEMYRQTQRVCVCLADETFGRFDWADGAEWPSLEARVFAVEEPTGFAPGGQCLRKLEELLQQRDPIYRELASVYFYALALVKPGASDIKGSMAALIQFLPTGAATPQWFPQSYAHTLGENRLTALPSAAKWLWLLTSILVFWLGLSWFLWDRVSVPVEDTLRAISAATIHVQQTRGEKQP